jgi:hypothetical protein
MNYSSVIVGGLTVAVAAWYLVICRRGYVGPGLVVREFGQRMHEGGEMVMGFDEEGKTQGV